MPNRIIKESVCDSERIASLSDFEFRLWVGLITQADDAGRGDARPAYIKGHVFPFRDRTTAKDIDAALHALAAKGCVTLYTVGGRPYFLFPSWAKHQRIRDCKPKYPGIEESDVLPQSAANCGELPQSAANCGLNPIQSEYESNPNTKSKSAGELRPSVRGQYGWVKLTDKQYEKMVSEFGETETMACIAYVDESAQQTGNKNKWKDWNLTVRKCHREGWHRRSTGFKQKAPAPTTEDRRAKAAALKKDTDWLDAFLAEHGEKEGGA